jgi:hypothetical protein
VEIEENRQAEAIAAEWSVDVEFLKETDWVVDTIDGNDDETYGYIVRFDEGTAPEILAQLGMAPGQFTRQLSINAFDEPEPDSDYEWAAVRTDDDYDRDLRLREGISSIDEPLPDIFEEDDEEEDDPFPKLPSGEALTDENDRILTDEEGRGQIVDVPEFERSVNATLPSDALKRELLSRLNSLEAALQTYQENLPPRNHNNPPALVEPDPISSHEFRVVVEATIEIRAEAQQPQPDPAKLEARASTLRTVARSILAWIGRKTDAAIDSVIKWGVPLGGAWMLAHPEKVYTALVAAAEMASALAQHFIAGG